MIFVSGYINAWQYHSTYNFTRNALICLELSGNQLTKPNTVRFLCGDASDPGGEKGWNAKCTLRAPSGSQEAYLPTIPDTSSNFVQIQSGVKDLIIGRGCINQPETKGEYHPIEIWLNDLLVPAGWPKNPHPSGTGRFKESMLAHAAAQSCCAPGRVQSRSIWEHVLVLTESYLTMCQSICL